MSRPLFLARAGTLVALMVLLIALVILLVLPRERGFSISAETEIVDITVNDELGVAARLPVARLASRPDETFPLAALEASAGASLRLMRKRDGDLVISVRWEDATQALAQLVTRDGDIVELAPGDSLRVSLNRPLPDGSMSPDTVLLAWSGGIDLGAGVTRQVETTLLSGRVQVLERQPLSGERFALFETQLDPGDHVLWRAADSSAAPAVGGFVHAGVSDALRVTAHAAADHLLVERFGAQGYVLRPSVWDRLANDPVINTLLVVMGLVLTLLGTLMALRGREGGK